MIIVGLTGGIASGKSFVINYLKKIKITTHESDKVIKDIYSFPKKIFIEYLKKEGFEKTIFKNKINKQKIREEIFQNINKRIILEKFLHNEVKKSREIFLKKHSNKKIVFLEIPLLFEKKLQNICNYVCSTIATMKIREIRALKRKGMGKKIFNKIIKIQTKDAIRRKKSDYLINTNKAKKETCLQVDNIIYDILKNNK